jgi:hypothetical protein
MTDDDPDRATESEREAAPLPDEAVVMRFGVSTPETLHKTALAHHDKAGDFAISARSLPGATADALARVEPRMGHAKLRETTVGALRAAGYDVIRDEPPPAHALIMLPRLPADDDYVVVSTTFGPARDNPAIPEEGENA